MSGILFHQYDSSPFSEKVRVCLGIKKLAWSCVDQPVIMPKPELVALTGGYRRIPVMQIGADIYCDSQLIVRELERRFPEPTLFPQGYSGLADGRQFLTGVLPGLVDANAYYNLWFVRSAFPPAASLFESAPHVREWMARVNAIGHGERSELSRDVALEIARDSQPVEGEIAPRDAPLAGTLVTVAADDYGRDPVSGVLVSSSEHHVAIRRTDPHAGQVVVHFPRIGFAIHS